MYRVADEILRYITAVDPAARMCYYAVLNLRTMQPESLPEQTVGIILDGRSIIKRLHSGKVKHTDRSVPPLLQSFAKKVG